MEGPLAICYGKLDCKYSDIRVLQRNVILFFLIYLRIFGNPIIFRFQGSVIQNLSVVSVSFQGLGHPRPGIPSDKVG